MSDHDHCDHDPIECTYDALVGEYQEAVAERDELRADLERERFARRTIDHALLEAVAERDDLQARIDAYEGRLEEWEEIDRLDRLREAIDADRPFQLAAIKALTAERDRLRADLAVERQNAKVLQGYADQAIENAVTAEAERDRLRAERDAASETLGEYIEAWREGEAERDRLRAVVDATLVWLHDMTEVARDQGDHTVADVTARQYRTIVAQLDVSPGMGDADG